MGQVFLICLRGYDYLGRETALEFQETIERDTAVRDPEPRTLILAMKKDSIHISEADATSNFASVLARVRAGAEILIENGHLVVAVIRPPVPPRRSISECIALLAQDSTAVMDADFAQDVEAAIESHREPLEPPEWA
jgi:antitoxin (DNA-binding transcriptional repressor) of toxin-antitoxin stability system